MPPPYPIKESRSLCTRIIDFAEQAKKLTTSFFFLILLVLSILFAVFLCKTALKRQLFIQPFKISRFFSDKGYRGEMMTMLFIRKIHDIQDTASSFYHASKIMLPAWDNKIDEYNLSLAGSAFSEIRPILQIFGSASETASTELMRIDSTSFFILKSADFEIKIISSANIDTILELAAEAMMKRVDPYNLAAYYIRRQQFDKSLHIGQELLNDDKASNDGLAMNLRGLSYLGLKDTPIAKGIFLQAVEAKKNSWFACNNLGVIYSHYQMGDSARRMFKQAMYYSPWASAPYLNYANLLFKEYKLYDKDPADSCRLDSAILFYKKAIARSRNESNCYLAALPALNLRCDTVASLSFVQKIIEMNNDNFNSLVSMGMYLKQRGLFYLANLLFIKAQNLTTDADKLNQLEQLKSSKTT